MNKESVIAVDDGRFAELLRVVGFKDECCRCAYFTGEYSDKMYNRCAVMGRCAGVTLSEDLKEYLMRKA